MSLSGVRARLRLALVNTIKGTGRRADAIAVVAGVGCLVAAAFTVATVAGLAVLGVGLIALGALGNR